MASSVFSQLNIPAPWGSVEPDYDRVGERVLLNLLGQREHSDKHKAPRSEEDPGETEDETTSVEDSTARAHCCSLLD